MFCFFLRCALKPGEQHNNHNCRSWSCPTKLSDSRKGSTLEIYLLLQHTSGLNNSTMHAAWRSHLLIHSLRLGLPQWQTPLLPHLPLLPLLPCSWWFSKCSRASLTSSPSFSVQLSWLRGGMRCNLSDMLKSLRVVFLAIYLPAAPHPDPSFWLYPSTKLLPVIKDVPVILLFFSGPLCLLSHPYRFP